MENKVIRELEKQNKSYQLGLIYEYGGGLFGVSDIAIDLDRSMDWYKSAYKNDGNNESLLAVARILLWKKGEAKTAYPIYKSLAVKGNAIAYLNMGVISEAGYLEEADLSQASKFYQKAYKLGNLRGGVFYTRLQFLPGCGNNLLTGCKYFIIHNFLRFKIFLIGLQDKATFKIRLF